MDKYFFYKLFLTFVFATVTQVLFSQATRTWVSGLGDDANPCSRTAPCKTFAGAISKTAIGGEINVLDPGGYGAVTITKSITIDGGGSFASILSSLTNGIIINAADAVVTIRHISINGAGNGIDGVKIISAKKIQVENCYLANFTQKGIEANGTIPYTLILNNVTVHNADEAVTIGNPAATAVIDQCKFQSVVNNGISLIAGQATVSNSNISDCGTGISAQANTTVNLSNNIISHNLTGLQGPGKINSAGNNAIVGNKVAGTAPTIKLQ